MELTLGEETITTFRQALERVSALAHAKLPPELHGNLERAHALVLHRHVWMDEDGKHAQVLSSDGTTWYLVNGNCTCMGTAHAPQALCKHRLSVMLYRRASELLASSGAPSATPAAAALPEAPASANTHLLIEGHTVQVTLRDSDEERLIVRLAALLARYPQACATKAKGEQASAPVQTSEGTPICATHGPMKASTKAPGTFYCSKKNFDGSYCQSRHPAQ